MAVGGKSIIEHNEILGMDAAMRYLNHTLSHVGSLTLEVINCSFNLSTKRFVK